MEKSDPPPPTQDSKKEVTLFFTTTEYLSFSFVIVESHLTTYFNDRLYLQSFKLIDVLFFIFRGIRLIKNTVKKKSNLKKNISES